MRNHVERQLGENFFERERQALGGGEHVGGQRVKLVFAGFEDDDQLGFFASIPFRAKPAFVVEPERNRIFKLNDGEALCLDRLKNAGVAEQPVGVGHGGNACRIGHKPPHNLFAPFRHGQEIFSMSNGVNCGKTWLCRFISSAWWASSCAS